MEHGQTTTIREKDLDAKGGRLQLELSTRAENIKRTVKMRAESKKVKQYYQVKKLLK